MIVKLLTEHHLEFLSLKGGCRGSSESTHVKMAHCWKSHAVAQIFSIKQRQIVLHSTKCFVIQDDTVQLLLIYISLQLDFAISTQSRVFKRGINM